MSELILYRSDDGLAEVSLRALDGSVWLSQAEIAELFQVTPQAVTQHIRAIYAQTELEPEATCKEDLQVRTEGARQSLRYGRSGRRHGWPQRRPHGGRPSGAHCAPSV
ncbi:MAG: hypothetical protein ACH34Y_09700 [Brachymonas sp.]